MMSESPVDTGNTYQVRIATLAEDGPRIVELWAANLGHAERRQAKFDWFYRNNPTGASTVFLLYHDSDRLIGTAGVGTRHMRCGSKICDAGLLADFAVDARYRTLFPALALQREVCRQALAGHGLLYGFPNRNALPVFKRAGFTMLGNLSRYTCLLRAQGLRRRILPGWLNGLAVSALEPAFHLRHMLWRTLASRTLRRCWLEAPDSRFDQLWAAQDDRLIMGLRDRGYLQWRFFDKSWRRSRLFSICAPTSDELLGYAVCEAEAETLHIRDCLVKPPAVGNLPQLLRALACDAARLGFSRLSMEIMVPTEWARALRRAGMRRRDANSQAVVCVATAQVAEQLRGRDWYCTGADADE